MNFIARAVSALRAKVYDGAAMSALGSDVYGGAVMSALRPKEVLMRPRNDAHIIIANRHLSL